MKELWSLFLTFAKVGVMTFGGGYAMLPILQREVVENKGWATDEELTDYFAIGQCTPGVIAVNTATFIGQKRAGIAGGHRGHAGGGVPVPAHHRGAGGSHHQLFPPDMGAARLRRDPGVRVRADLQCGAEAVEKRREGCMGSADLSGSTGRRPC